MQTVTLIGAEDVARAASSMREAAAEISRAVANLDSTLDRHQRALLPALEELNQRVADLSGSIDALLQSQSNSKRSSEHG